SQEGKVATEGVTVGAVIDRAYSYLRSPRNLNTAVEARGDGTKVRDMFGERITDKNSGVFDVDAVGKLGVTVASHQKEVICRDGVKLFIAKGRSIIQGYRYETFSFRLTRIQPHADAADAHNGTSENALDLCAGQPHRHKRIFRWEHIEQHTAGNRAFTNACLWIRCGDQGDRRTRLRAQGIRNKVAHMRFLCRGTRQISGSMTDNLLERLV